ncbi:MAG: hypothetical protein IJ410_06575 [Oscillospiraceae bacterium]|nr:hypothetical protein [Oscillospiraceae bacterium]
MEILKIAGIVLVGVVLVSSMPAFDKSVTSLIRLSVCVVIMAYIISCARGIIDSVRSLTDSYLTADFSVVYKSVGISIITRFVSDVASDSGNKALANRMIFAGKSAIALLALPVFMQVLEIIKRLTG